MAYVLAAVLVACSGASPAGAGETVLAGMTWMTQFPATWNAAAPKVVSDGLFTYAALTGFNGDPFVWSIVRRRGIETAWEQGAPAFRSSQPPVVVLDRKGRLNVFYNDPKIRHLRFDHPQVSLAEYREIPVPFSADVAYLNAGYDPASDTLRVVFNEVPSFTLHFAIKYTDFNDWTVPSPMPAPSEGNVYVYARSVHAGGRYAVLAGEHPRSGPNANYTAAVLLESASPFGPWTVRTLHRSTGANLGVPYQNWVFPVDLQATPAGTLRALLHVGEDGSGHVPLPEGFHVAREEDGYGLTHVGRHIDDGFALHIDDSGVELAFGQLFGSAPQHPGKLVYFRSADGGRTWSAPQAVDVGINPSLVDRRSGSLLGGEDLAFLYCASRTAPYQTYTWTTVPLGVGDTGTRWDWWARGADGALDYVRSYTEPGSGRSYFFLYDHEPSGAFTVTYSYTAGSYYQVYSARSNGSYQYYNSDGHVVTYEAPEGSGYWFTGGDGASDYVYVFRDPANEVLWWVIYDYDPSGNWVFTYVYYRGAYWYVETSRSSGSFTKSDSTGFFESG
jgi:hypothetical protein